MIFMKGGVELEFDCLDGGSSLEFITTFVLDFISHWGLIGVFVLMTLSSMCVPIPSEVVILFSGYLAFLGKMDLIAVIGVSAVGNLVGSVVAYYIGLVGGRPLFLKYGRYVFVRERELDWAERWFEKYGHETVFFGRMVPMVRAFVSVPAGVAEMNIFKFNIYTLLGILPWSIGLAYAGFYLGAKWQNITKYFSLVTIIVGIVLMAAVGYFIYIHVRKRKSAA